MSNKEILSFCHSFCDVRILAENSVNLYMDKTVREQHKKAIFWSYSEIPQDKNTLIEHTLKYADVADIKKIITEFGAEACIEVWQKILLPDKRFRKMNFFLAKFVFNVSTDDEEIKLYFKNHSKTRAERINEVFNS